VFPIHSLHYYRRRHVKCILRRRGCKKHVRILYYSPPLRGAYSESSLFEIEVRLSSDSQTNQLHNFKIFAHCTWYNTRITLRRSKPTIISSDVPAAWSRMLVVKITFSQLVSNFHCVLWKKKFHHAVRESTPQTLSWTT
jgi:hypothetical protein